MELQTSGTTLQVDQVLASDSNIYSDVYTTEDSKFAHVYYRDRGLMDVIVADDPLDLLLKAAQHRRYLTFEVSNESLVKLYVTVFDQVYI